MKKTKAYWNRIIHRDLAYFFLGLIIAFSISGITLNHRESFSSREYSIESKEVSMILPESQDQITETFIRETSKSWDVPNELRGFEVDGKEIVIFYKNAFGLIDIDTGKGRLEFSKPIPVLKQMTILHQTTNTWWIWFSDIFGIAMLTITITGMFIIKGKNSFKRYGWKLTLIGLIFPFIFLFFIN
ncbi:PepSY-associated TM helix domain-containing protein [Aquimarina sp. Aq78]|uniref:PepSY-associated TM helix domain-containing protein n=1 Tax=Aquimarina sp. Aq78 TaxID=1191889 RepID=UPI000D0F8D58|nr:PepSY-associated TM helix domain-containing protein [Aquimarina sp. Aq78]